MYTIRFASAVKKYIRKLDKPLQSSIVDTCLPDIEQDPFTAIPLLQQFKGLWSYHLNYKGTHYRIVYEIIDEDRVVLVIMIGSREFFYQSLKHRLKTG